ncbi:MAG: hypothetical protein P8X46_08425 [Nitrospirales bacterium]
MKDSFSMDSIGWNLAIQTDPNWDFRLTGQYTDSTVRSFPEGSGGHRLALLRETEKRTTHELLAGFAASFFTPSGWRHHLFLSISRGGFRTCRIQEFFLLQACLQFHQPILKLSTTGCKHG